MRLLCGLNKASSAKTVTNKTVTTWKTDYAIKDYQKHKKMKHGAWYTWNLSICRRSCNIFSTAVKDERWDTTTRSLWQWLMSGIRICRVRITDACPPAAVPKQVILLDWVQKHHRNMNLPVSAALYLVVRVGLRLLNYRVYTVLVLFCLFVCQFHSEEVPLNRRISCKI